MHKLFAIGTCLMAMFAVSEAFHASVKGNNHYCIMFEGNLTGSINYEKTDKSTASYGFNVDESTLNISGECLHIHKNVSTETLTIAFLPVNATQAQQQWSLKIDLVKPRDDVVEVGRLSLLASFPPEFNSSAPTKEYRLKDGGDKWHVTETQGTEGYSCSASKFELDEKSFVEFENLRVVAFAQLTEDKFPLGQVYKECAADSKTSQIVPIIVGACLAGLVIIVLVAYLIGRARAKRQGYASV